MKRPTQRRAGKLSRDRVLRAAVDLADEHGLEALTMRSVGQRLGVEAMSLYRHVEHKDDLLDGMVDLVYAAIEVPTDDPDWRSAMRRRAISARNALRRHPWAIALMESRASPGEANLRHRDDVLGVFRRAGFSGASATHAVNLLDSFTYGFALQEATMPFSGAEGLAEMGPALLEMIPADQFPNLAHVAGELLDAGFDYGAEFEFGLDIILNALDQP